MDPAPQEVLAVRLLAGRLRHFVGRSAELELFRAALAGERSDFAVLYVHGVGGIGKTSLLRRLADDATAAGRPVIWVDADMLGSIERLAAAATAARRHLTKAIEGLIELLWSQELYGAEQQLGTDWSVG
jgi:ABC-type transport system involved in cytochrome c biogenesis ATPase subunit